MATVLVLEAPGGIGFEDVPEPPLADDEIRVRTLYSGISAGTELAYYRGTNPYLHKHWNPVLRLFEASSPPTAAYPLRGWGYEQVGEVVETGRSVRGRGSR